MRLESEKQPVRSIEFYGGSFGAILPFLVFVTGVIVIALSGAPDERGFWPVLILSLALGLFLSKNRNEFSEVVIEGMSQKIIMIMITAWILASTIGILMQITGLVDALIWISMKLTLGGPGFIVATFLICCIVSLSTGSSFATILICTPMLYPAGGLLGSDLPLLAGAIIGGATFGDFIAPISDTTIASALSQNAEIGPTVKSRIRYIAPVVGLVLLVYLLYALLSSPQGDEVATGLSGSPRGLPMLLVPILIIGLFLRKKHLLYGLMAGLVLGIILGLSLGLLPFEKLISLDLENFTANSFIIDGINRAVGISFFTILLMGLVATLKASGLLNRFIALATRNSKTQKQSEVWISGTVAAAVLLTTHSIVAILTVSDFAKTTGEKMGITPTRRANLLSLVCCVFPFVLPYFIPVILMANMTSSGAEYGIAKLAPLEVGLYNFVSWGLLAVLLIVVIFGLGNQKNKHEQGRES